MKQNSMFKNMHFNSNQQLDHRYQTGGNKRLILIIVVTAAVILSNSGQTHAGTLTEAELQLWNDPAFKKQFAESYMAETEIEPRVTVEERERMEEILELISSDKMDKAAEKLEKARKKSASAVFDFTLANIYFQQDKLDEAAALYQTAVETYPKFRRAWKNLGIIYVRQGEYEKATSALTRVVALGGNDAITFGLLGFSYSSEENYLSAESAYQMAILLDPVTLDWKMGLARSYFKQDRYAEAVSLCSQLIKTYPDRTDLWLLQANAYIGMNQPLKAAEIYILVDNLGKSTYESLNMLGDIYVNEKLYKLAVDAYIRAMYKQPKNSAERAIRSAKVLAARSALDETQMLVNKIMELYGDRLGTEQRKDLLKLRARIVVAKGGSSEKEIQLLKEIVDLDPLDGEALILLGQHSFRNNDNEMAINYFEQAAGIEACEADAKVQQAKVLVQMGKYADALPLLRRSQAVKPRDNVQKYLEQVERIAKTKVN